MSGNVEDPVEEMLKKTGCIELHYKVQECIAEKQDWRQCQDCVKEFKTCMSKRIFNITQAVPKALKMVLVVRTDLRLSKGKTASQCAHAAVMCYDRSLSTGRGVFVDAWKVLGQPKVVLRVENAQEMEKLYNKAKTQEITAILVHDAGRTEIPSGTMTVLGLGPDCSEKLKDIVGELKIL